MTQNSAQLEVLAGAAGFAVAGRVFGRAIVFLSGVLAGRFLGPENFGIYAIGLSFFRVAIVVLPLGFDIAIVKFNAANLRGNASAFKGSLVYSMGIVAVVAGLFAAILFLGAPWLSEAIFHKLPLVQVLRVIAFCLPLAAVVGLGGAATTVAQDVRFAVALQDLGQPLISLACLVVLLAAGYGLFGAVLADLIGFAVAAAATVLVVWRLFPSLLRKDVAVSPPRRQYYSFSFASAAGLLVSTSTLWADRLLLGHFVSSSQVGIYQAAMQIAVVFAVILSGLNRLFLPAFAGSRNEQDRHALQDSFRLGTKWAAFLGFPILVLLLVNSNEIIKARFGPSFLPGGKILLILLIGQALNLVTGPVGIVLLTEGYQKLSLWLSIQALLLDVSLNLVLVPRFGMLGTAFASSISIGLFYVLLMAMAHRRLGMRPYDWRYAKLMLAAAASFAGAWAGKLIPGGSGWAEIGFQLLIVSATFVLALALLKLEPEDYALLSGIKGRLLKSRAGGNT